MEEKKLIRITSREIHSGKVSEEVMNALQYAKVIERKLVERDARRAIIRYSTLENVFEVESLIPTHQILDGDNIDFSFCFIDRESYQEIREMKNCPIENIYGQYSFIDVPLDYSSCEFKGSLLFEHATFSLGASFEGAVISGNASFEGAKFSDDVSFEGVTFSGDASFDGASFSGGAWFGKTVFSGGAWFGATFCGRALFDRATFCGRALFDWAKFFGIASFDWAVFAGGAWFGKAKFSGDASFDKVKFSSAVFSVATFVGGAWFGGVRFSGAAAFDGAKFSGSASFDDVTFFDEASFLMAFFADVSFGRTMFSGGAWFGKTKFSCEALFDGVTFSGDVSFDGATFSENASFNGAKFSNVTFVGSTVKQSLFFRVEKLDSLVLDETRIKDLEVLSTGNSCARISLRKTVIEESVAIDIRLKTLDLRGAVIGRHIKIKWNEATENAIKCKISQRGENESLKKICEEVAEELIVLKENYRFQGRYDDEGSVYVEYKRMQRVNQSFAKKVFSDVAYLIGEYGTSPFRVAIWAILVVFYFGVLYYAFWPNFAEVDISAELGDRIINAFYLSGKVFVTMGFADMRSEAVWPVLPIMIEGLLGLFLMIYFTMSFARKVLR